jgi:predicted RNase H-like HicB family nuclease
MYYMAIDWTKIYNKYKGKWVALAEDEKTVIAFGSTLKEALDKARKASNVEPILTRIPEDLQPFVGTI